MGIFMLFTNILLEAICFVVYKLVMFMERGVHCIAYVYKLSWSLVLNIS